MMGGSHLFFAIYVLVTHGPMVPHCARITNYNLYETSILFFILFYQFKPCSKPVQNRFKHGSIPVQNQFKPGSKAVLFYRGLSLLGPK